MRWKSVSWICSLMAFFAVALFVGVLGEAAHAATIFSEGFGGATADSNITTGNTSFTAISGTGTNATLFALTDTGSVFANANQYLQYNDASTSLSPAAVASWSALSNSVFALSFDFFDVDDPTGTTAAPRLILSNGSSATSTNQLVNLSFVNGALDATIDGAASTTVPLTGGYTMNAPHHIDVYGNMSASGVTYGLSSESLGAGKFDVWFDGAKVANIDDLSFRFSQTSLTELGIRVTSNGGSRVTRLNFDNFSVTDTLPSVPEPSSMFLACCGVLGVSLFRRRRSI
jgi:hypothetical protein